MGARWVCYVEDAAPPPAPPSAAEGGGGQQQQQQQQQVQLQVQLQGPRAGQDVQPPTPRATGLPQPPPQQQQQQQQGSKAQGSSSGCGFFIVAAEALQLWEAIPKAQRSPGGPVLRPLAGKRGQAHTPARWRPIAQYIKWHSPALREAARLSEQVQAQRKNAQPHQQVRALPDRSTAQRPAREAPEGPRNSGTLGVGVGLEESPQTDREPPAAAHRTARQLHSAFAGAAAQQPQKRSDPQAGGSGAKRPHGGPQSAAAPADAPHLQADGIRPGVQGGRSIKRPRHRAADQRGVDEP